jgi:hypothetical protein
MTEEDYAEYTKALQIMGKYLNKFIKEDMGE